MKQQARASAVLLAEMALKIGAHKALEIYLAANGLKITRTMMLDTELNKFLPIISDLNIEILLSKEKFLSGTDVGKGGYGNSFGAVVPTDHPHGHFCVYIGRDLLELDEARRLDENGDDDRFGEILGNRTEDLNAFQSDGFSLRYGIPQIGSRCEVHEHPFWFIWDF